jgi:hypothetical protein
MGREVSMLGFQYGDSFAGGSSFAGTPTAVCPGGTGLFTSAAAATVAPAPTSILPSTVDLAPRKTCGTRDRSRDLSGSSDGKGSGKGGGICGGPEFDQR